jgi:hypothetical protein
MRFADLLSPSYRGLFKGGIRTCRHIHVQMPRAPHPPPHSNSHPRHIAASARRFLSLGDHTNCQTTASFTPLADGGGGFAPDTHPGDGGQASLNTQ